MRALVTTIHYPSKVPVFLSKKFLVEVYNGAAFAGWPKIELAEYIIKYEIIDVAINIVIKFLWSKNLILSIQNLLLIRLFINYYNNFKII